jgi:MOSC N-terminal beta barrel domain
MVTTADYVFLTQRKKPKMSLIAPSIEGSKLEINAPGMAALRLALSPDFKDCKPVQTA